MRHRFVVCLTVFVLLLAPYQMGMAVHHVPMTASAVDVTGPASAAPVAANPLTMDIHRLGDDCNGPVSLCAGCVACAPLAGTMPVVLPVPVRPPSPGVHLPTLLGMSRSPVYRPPIVQSL